MLLLRLLSFQIRPLYMLGIFYVGKKSLNKNSVITVFAFRITTLTIAYSNSRIGLTIVNINTKLIYSMLLVLSIKTVAQKEVLERFQDGQDVYCYMCHYIGLKCTTQYYGLLSCLLQQSYGIMYLILVQDTLPKDNSTILSQIILT